MGKTDTNTYTKGKDKELAWFSIMNLSLIVLIILQSSPTALDGGKCLAPCPRPFYTTRIVTIRQEAGWTAETKWEW